MNIGFVVMKIVHLAAVVIFLGNILTAIFWKAQGDRTRDPRIIAHTMAGIIRADRVFTMPSVAILLIAGLGAQGMAHYPITLPWILGSLILYLLSAGVFMARVAPVQKRLAAIAASGSMDWSEYDRLSGQWRIWELIATLLPIVAFVLMVWKPA